MPNESIYKHAIAVREYIAHILLKENVLESHGDRVGFWRGDEFISFYDLLDQHLL